MIYEFMILAIMVIILITSITVQYFLLPTTELNTLFTVKTMPKTSPPSPQELKQLAKKRLQEAETLFANGNYEGAVYLCGYAIELALKARICKTLKWRTTFPDSDVREPRSFITHDLPALLSLSGIRDKIRSNYLTEWSTIEKWTPEMRYQLNPEILKLIPGQPQTVQQLAENILNSVKILMRVL